MKTMMAPLLDIDLTTAFDRNLHLIAMFAERLKSQQ